MVKDRIEIVQRVADFIDRKLLALAQFAIRPERFLLKKETDPVARREKVIIARARLFAG